MQLTCPKCNARYEVTQAAIPTEGRDVQCSGCGTTWFQAHPDHPPRPAASPAGPSSAKPPHIDPESSGRNDSDGEDDAPAAQLAHRELDPAVIEILRQEAERETRLRALERNAGLESQPELGLDFSAPGAPGQGSNRNESGSGENHSPRNGQDDALPDRTAPPFDNQPDPPVSRAGSTGRFLSGFALTIAAALALVLIYANATVITQSLPQTASAMDIYVAKVDRGRVWLDSTIGNYVPAPTE
ncbi:zinc-ribbon domain-containing protein [Rhodobacteraceae bacterium F11138]|nr:zinc-ribbon domain-containing protein [Rhodobacteraceae bacterium F11138]